MNINNCEDLKIQSDLNLYNFIKGMIYEHMNGIPMPECRRVTYEDYSNQKKEKEYGS